METPIEIQGGLEGHNRRFAIVASRFNGRLVEEMVRGAIDALHRHGVSIDDVRLVRVPGAWEIPLALDRLASSGRFDGLIAIGLVIRGETPHFDYVCSRAAQGAGGVCDRTGLPVGFGILTCDTSDQARERCGGKAGNKGWEAAMAALEMVSLLAAIDDDTKELD